MKLNLNETCQVVLTARGAKVWNTWNANLWKDYAHTTPVRKHAGDVHRGTLWQLFQVFGSDIHMGCQVPFEDCNIIIGDI